MILPGTMRVGGRDYAVMFPHVFQDSPSVLYGLHDPSAQTIKVSVRDEFGCDRHEQSVACTFVHEMLHAIDYVYNGGRLTAWERGEETIDQLAEGLLQVIRDNGIDFREGVPN